MSVENFQIIAKDELRHSRVLCVEHIGKSYGFSIRAVITSQDLVRWAHSESARYTTYDLFIHSQMTMWSRSCIVM